MKKLFRVMAALLALLIVLPMVALAESGDASGLLAMVNGTPVEIGEAQEDFSYYAYMYRLYGLEDEDIEMLKEDIAAYYVQLQLIYDECDRLGLSDGIDMEAIRQQAQEEYDAAVASSLEYMADEALSDEENVKAVEDMLSEQGYTVDRIAQNAYDNERLRLVYEHYTADITVSEEEIEAYYQERLEADRELFSQSPASYEAAMDEGARALYTPEGMRYVKHILVTLPEDAQERMYEIELRLEEIGAEMEADDADTEALTAEKEALQAEADGLFEEIDGIMAGVVERIEGGEDFLDLLDELGEDPGMMSEPYHTVGYLVYPGKSFMDSFLEASLALEKVGDMSEPVRTSYGLHLIRYEDDLPAGEVPFEDARDELEAELLEGKISEEYNALVLSWYEEADVTLYLENLVEDEDEE